MLNRSGKITRKTIEMRSAGTAATGYGPLNSAKDGESDAERQTAGAWNAGGYELDTSCGQRGAEMDDAAKIVYADVVLKGLRDAGIDVSGLEQGIIAPLGTHFATVAATGREIDRETADLLDAFGTYEPRGSAGSGTDAEAGTPDERQFTRFQFDLPEFEAPSFTMPVSSKPDIKSVSTVETVRGIRYSDALGNTGSMTALDPDMLAAHGMYSKNISESARRAFTAASSKGGSDGSAHGMTPLGTVRGETADCGENSTPSENGTKSETERKEMRYAERRRADAPRHAAPSGQKGTASELIERGYRKPAGDTASFMAVAEEAGIVTGGKRFRTQSPDDTSTFVALAEKSREMIENGIDDGATPFETARHVARLTVVEAPIAIALVAAMTLGIGGMTAAGRLSDAGGFASGIGTGVDGIIGQIGGLTTQAEAETTDGMQQYPHETIEMASVLTAPQSQVMSWTGYCTDGWWFAGRTWPTDILSGSGQERVHDAWNAAGSVFTNHVATLDGRYLVAVKPTLGAAGQYIDITLENGTVIPAIVADTKGNENYGAADFQYVHSDGSIIELEVDADYGIEKSTGDVKSSGNVQSWIPEWASLVKSVTKYERYV